jgi:N-glycosylase/DNA lyase
MIPQYQIQKNDIEDVVLKVSNYVYPVKNKNNSWTNLSEQDIWHELVSCILGSRIDFQVAFFHTKLLCDKELLDIHTILDDPKAAERSIIESLSSQNMGKKFSVYPFSISRSNYIIRTTLNIYQFNNTSLKKVLNISRNEVEARERIFELASGVGYKQASLFLRNIGFSSKLAILDTHVIKYMMIMELLSNFSKKDISNKKKYVEAENTLINYATLRNQLVSRLDIAIWVVMRLLDREYVYGNSCFSIGGN